MEISVTVKLYAGLEKDSGIEEYDPARGIRLAFPGGTRLKEVIRRLQLKDSRRLIYFINGKRVGMWRKLRSGDEISCLRPLAGG